MTTPEVELKLLVPASARAAVSAEMTRPSSSSERESLAAVYLDTPDRRLARAGLSWRLRREGQQWVQTLKASGSHSMERFEHEVIRPDAMHDAAAHAHTPVGKQLAEVLDRARADGVEVSARFRTEVQRARRRVRVRGAVVEVAFDEGKLIAGEMSIRLCEVKFERVSGSTLAMLMLAERWRKRFGLVYEPRTKAQRGDRLADGERNPPIRKANPLLYLSHATANEAFGVVLDECLAHITHSAIGLIEGGVGPEGVEHVHQLRVGVRRLRSALRSFEGWTPTPPAKLVDGLKGLFTELGKSRDSDVLAGGVAAALAKAGAPPLALAAPEGALDPAKVVQEEAVQHIFLRWIAWRISLIDQGQPTVPQQATATEGEPAPAAREVNPRRFHRDAESRLRRWHLHIVADWEAFDELNEPSLHALRKRIKRQRYAVEFFTPVLKRREVDRYMKPLAVVQHRMGELIDLFVARARYEQLVESKPEAWFALGWITARIAEVRAQAKSELSELAHADVPRR